MSKIQNTRERVNISNCLVKKVLVCLKAEYTSLAHHSFVVKKRVRERLDVAVPVCTLWSVDGGIMTMFLFLSLISSKRAQAKQRVKESQVTLGLLQK